jgi:hypothetical protein
MNMTKSIEALDTIERALCEYEAGWNNTDARAVIHQAVFVIRCEAGDHSQVREKLVSLSGWVDKLYSPRKHGRWGGVDCVKGYALADCSGLRRLLRLVADGEEKAYTARYDRETTSQVQGVARDMGVDRKPRQTR